MCTVIENTHAKYSSMTKYRAQLVNSEEKTYIVLFISLTHVLLNM